MHPPVEQACRRLVVHIHSRFVVVRGVAGVEETAVAGPWRRVVGWDGVLCMISKRCEGSPDEQAGIRVQEKMRSGLGYTHMVVNAQAAGCCMTGAAFWRM
jgi:hypothetical protein